MALSSASILKVKHSQVAVKPAFLFARNMDISAHAIICYCAGGMYLEPPTLMAHTLTLNSVIQRDPGVIAAEANQDLIMVSIDSGQYYGLADVARQIWEAIEHPKKVSDLVDELAADYGVDLSTCKEQTLSFLDDLLDEGLLQVKDEQTD